MRLNSWCLFLAVYQCVVLSVSASDQHTMRKGYGSSRSTVTAAAYRELSPLASPGRGFLGAQEKRVEKEEPTINDPGKRAHR